jgi:hypothetical protein
MIITTSREGGITVVAAERLMCLTTQLHTELSPSQIIAQVYLQCGGGVPAANRNAQP